MAFYIEHRIGIGAPPEVVWAILSDIEGWPAWAPHLRRANGNLRIGDAVVVEQALEGEEPETLTYRVLDWAPDIQIHLQTRLYAGLFSTTRYMEIDKLSEVGCIFGNGEIFKGPLSRFVPRRLKSAIRRSFVEMSEALKLKAEAAWAAREDGLG
jgi:hypothetical protein